MSVEIGAEYLIGAIVAMGGALAGLVKLMLSNHTKAIDNLTTTFKESIAAIGKDSEENRKTFRYEVDMCQAERVKNADILTGLLLDNMTGKVSVLPQPGTTIQTTTTAVTQAKEIPRS